MRTRPLARAMEARVTLLGRAFRRVVFGQVRISALNTLLTAATTCRPAAAQCDAPELCTGDEAACPADSPVADDTPCSDGVCVGGVCEPTSDTTSTGDTDDTGDTGDTGATSTTTTTTGATSTGPSDTGGDPEVPTTGAAGSSGIPTGTGVPPDTTGAPDEATDTSSGSDTAGQTDSGCGCATGHAPGGMYLLTFAALALTRRRRATSTAT